MLKNPNFSGFRPEPRWGLIALSPADPIAGGEGARCPLPKNLTSLSALRALRSGRINSNPLQIQQPYSNNRF